MEEDGREEEKEPLAEPEHFVNSSLESESDDPEVDALAQQVAAKGSSGDENRIVRLPGHIQCHVTYRSAYLYHLYHPPGRPPRPGATSCATSPTVLHTSTTSTTSLTGRPPRPGATSSATVSK